MERGGGQLAVKYFSNVMCKKKNQGHPLAVAQTLLAWQWQETGK